MPVFDESGAVVGYHRPNAEPSSQQSAPQQSAPKEPAQDFGFEAYLSHMLTEAGGMQMSGGDNKAGWTFANGPYRGKSKAEVMDMARGQWAQMDQDNKEPFIQMGNNRDIRGPGVAGTPLANPNGARPAQPVASGVPVAFAPDTSHSGLSGKSYSKGEPHSFGPSPHAMERYNAMGQQQQQGVQHGREAVQAIGDFYASHPTEYVDRNIEAHDAQLAKDGITDMGGGQEILNNKYGVGVVTNTPQPTHVFDERGEVDLGASKTSGSTVYKRDATGNIAMHPTTPESVAAIQAQQNVVAGAGLPITDPRSPESRRAVDRSTAIAKVQTNPVFQNVVKQSDANANQRGAAITNSALAQPSATERQVQSAATALPIAPPARVAAAPAPMPPKVMAPSPLIRPPFA